MSLPIPPINLSLLLRTDFSDDAVWERVCDLLQQPTQDGFEAGLYFVSVRTYDGVTACRRRRPHH
jgi:hypothetical protein